MNALAHCLFRPALRFGVVALAGLGLSFAPSFVWADPTFVYETSAEFLAAGDFSGDGHLDTLVLDKITGNARVGYSDGLGHLTWSAPLVTGVGDATGCGVGRWLQTTRDALAVTAPAQNRINLVDLSGTNTAGAPVIVTPLGLGPHTVVPLANFSGGAAPAYNSLLAASSDNNASAELLDLMGVSAGAASEISQFGETGPFDRGNAVQLTITPATFAAGLVRGPTDALHLWQFTNLPSVFLAYTNLPSGSDYAFGNFNGETLPRFLFYVPGSSNLAVAPLTQSGGSLAFGPLLVEPLADIIQGVFYSSSAAADGSFMLLFSNGVESLRFPGGTPVFSSLYSSGAGAGDVFTGLVPLGAGTFALLDGPPGGAPSAHVQVMHFDGTNFVQLSAGNLPAVTTRNTRANVWVFLSEPFVNRAPGFVASFDTPDWSDAVNGLPGALKVTTETDSGASSGLGSIGTNNLGAPPTGSAYGLPNQYNPAISLFSYNSPQAAEPVAVNISPPPGLYDGPINISFSTLNAFDRVFYRVGPSGSWNAYASAFPLTNDNTIEYYGTNASSHTRSVLLTAVYSLGVNNQATPTLNLGNGSSSTNPPPSYSSPSNTIVSSVGTIFYGRRGLSITGAQLGSVWAVNYDGSGDTYVTAGVRPRASRDGKWLAFLRGASAFQSHGDVWIRNLQTGAERLLFSNTGTIVHFDWLPDDSGLIMDYNCTLSYLGTNGVVTLAENTDCYQEVPSFNPVDGRLAAHDLYPNSFGIDVAKNGISNLTDVVNTVFGATWPRWSPDGQRLCFVDDNTINSLDTGTNLWVCAPDGTLLNRICDFTGTSNRFPHGAVWSPDSGSLVGAATIDGTNGIWIIPLNPDRTDCIGQAMLLPLTLGDPVDFVGSIVVPPPPAPGPLRLIIQRAGPNSVVLSWNSQYPAYVLQYTTSLEPPVTWRTIPSPYIVAGSSFEYFQSLGALPQAEFFRLALPPP